MRCWKRATAARGETGPVGVVFHFHLEALPAQRSFKVTTVLAGRLYVLAVGVGAAAHQQGDSPGEQGGAGRRGGVGVGNGVPAQACGEKGCGPGLRSPDEEAPTGMSCERV